MTIGVFFGSQSPEHEVSIITGQLIISELLNIGHSVVAIYLTKNRQWLVQKMENQNSNLENQSWRNGLLSLKSFENLESEAWIKKDWQNWQINLENNENKKLILTKKGYFKDKKLVIDAVIPALHGSFGEDGTLQGLLEILDVPFVGCNVLASSLGMDKIMTKIIAENAQVPTAKFVSASEIEIKNWQKVDQNNQNQTELPNDYENFQIEISQSTRSKAEFIQKVEANLSYPVFVKPPKLGSSIGITKAHNLAELSDAIDVCLYYDEQILVEMAVENLADLTCCVLEKSSKNSLETSDNNPKIFSNLISSLVQESLYSAEMFSFEDKYLDGGGAQTGNNQKSLIIPAQIDEKITQQIQNFSQILFTKMSCNGIARFDFLLNRVSGELYFSEVNTLPGNFYKHLWQESGISFGQVLTNLLEVATESSQKNLIYSFKSDLIKMANSSKMGGKLKG